MSKSIQFPTYLQILTWGWVYELTVIMMDIIPCAPNSTFAWPWRHSSEFVSNSKCGFVLMRVKWEYFCYTFFPSNIQKIILRVTSLRLIQLSSLLGFVLVHWDCQVGVDTDCDWHWHVWDILPPDQSKHYHLKAGSHSVQARWAAETGDLKPAKPPGLGKDE